MTRTKSAEEPPNRVNSKPEAEVAEELKSIQDSKSISDIINFKQISPSRIKLVPKNTAEFYAEYFDNCAKLLRKELEQTEQGDTIFK